MLYLYICQQPDNSDLFKGCGPQSSGLAHGLSYSGGYRSGEKAQRWGGEVRKCEDTMVQNYIFPNRKHFLLNLLKSSWNLRKWNIWFIMLSLKCDQPCVNFPTYFQQWNLNWDTPFHNSSIDTKIGTFES